MLKYYRQSVYGMEYERLEFTELWKIALKTQTIILFHIKSMQFFVEWLSFLNFRKFYHFPEKLNIVQKKPNINLLHRFKWVLLF